MKRGEHNRGGASSRQIPCRDKGRSRLLSCAPIRTVAIFLACLLVCSVPPGAARTLHPGTARKAVPVAGSGEPFESVFSEQDATLQTDLKDPFWRHARPIVLEMGNFGEREPGIRTEVRSRWTSDSLYLLFRCPYEELSVRPKPVTLTETNELWKWNVAELFLGTDFTNIRRYKEFEVSPQGEWIDLDIDLNLPDHTVGRTWNSGFQVAARIDRENRVWYAAMRIPFAALEANAPRVGRTYRANLFRTEGSDSRERSAAWKAPMSKTFHTPQRFGLLKLVGR